MVHGRLLQIILNEKAKGKNSFTFIILTNTTKLDVQIKETFLNTAFQFHLEAVLKILILLAILEPEQGKVNFKIYSLKIYQIFTFAE